MNKSVLVQIAWRSVLAVFFSCAGIVEAWPQQPTAAINLLDYIGSTARVQDPPGSPWKSVPVAELPKPTPITGYKSGQWVEIQYQARTIRINMANVMLDRVAPLNGQIARQPSGSQPMLGFGGPGFGR